MDKELIELLKHVTGSTETFEFFCKGLAWFAFALVCLVVVLFYLAHRNGNYPSDEG